MLLIGEGTATGSDGEKQGCVLLRNESQIMLHFTNFQTKNSRGFARLVYGKHMLIPGCVWYGLVVVNWVSAYTTEIIFQSIPLIKISLKCFE